MSSSSWSPPIPGCAAPIPNAAKKVVNSPTITTASSAPQRARNGSHRSCAPRAAISSSDHLQERPLSWDGPWSTLCTGEIGGDSMTRMSVVERRALESLRAAEEDASSGPALASRALLILQEATGFAGGYLLAVAPDSLLFPRLLAYRGERFARFAYWLRDGYLLERAAFPDIAFPALLRDFGGIIVLHERVDRWIGNVPRPASEEGGGHMWRGVDRPPDAGHLLFGPDRRLAYVDSPGDRWIDRLPEDGLRAHGMNVPVAAQSLVNHLVSDPTSEAPSRLVDRHGVGGLARATRAGPGGGGGGAGRGLGPRGGGGAPG